MSLSKRIIKTILKPIITEIVQEYLEEEAHKNILYFHKENTLDIKINRFFENILKSRIKRNLNK